MEEDKSTQILKNAILLEKRGEAFYSRIADQASSKEVKRFFRMLADEENKHIQVLSDQFKAYQQNKKFDPKKYPVDDSENIASGVLTEEIKSKISAADYEAAAISAAMSMEKNAITLYSGRAAEAEDLNEKALYAWLARWETQHLDFLAAIDKELTEQIWYDNSFWPF
jgi:rubrerythrin